MADPNMDSVFQDDYTDVPQPMVEDQHMEDDEESAQGEAIEGEDTEMEESEAGQNPEGEDAEMAESEEGADPEGEDAEMVESEEGDVEDAEEEAEQGEQAVEGQAEASEQEAESEGPLLAAEELEFESIEEDWCRESELDDDYVAYYSEGKPDPDPRLCLAVPEHPRLAFLYNGIDFKEAKIIFVYGPPGSERHKYATHFCFDFGIVYLTEDVLMERLKLRGNEGRIRTETGVGLEDALRLLRSYKHADTWGRLPDGIVFEAFKSEIAMHMAMGQYIFMIDGMPRTVGQFEWFSQTFHVLLTINVSSSKEASLDSVIARKDYGEGWCTLDWWVADETDWECVRLPKGPETEPEKRDDYMKKKERKKDRKREWEVMHKRYEHDWWELGKYGPFLRTVTTVDSGRDFDQSYNQVLNGLNHLLAAPMIRIERLKVQQYAAGVAYKRYQLGMAHLCQCDAEPVNDGVVLIGDLNEGRVARSSHSQRAIDAEARPMAARGVRPVEKDSDSAVEDNLDQETKEWILWRYGLEKGT